MLHLEIEYVTKCCVTTDKCGHGIFTVVTKIVKAICL